MGDLGDADVNEPVVMDDESSDGGEVSSSLRGIRWACQVLPGKVAEVISGDVRARCKVATGRTGEGGAATAK